MRKIIKKWGTSAGIIFNKNDLECYDLKIGDHIEIEVVIIKKVKK